MKFEIDQTEVEDAIKAHLSNLIVIKDGSEIEIDFRAGRGGNGLTATVEVTKPGQAKAAKAEPTAEVTKPTKVTMSDLKAQQALETVDEEQPDVSMAQENAAEDAEEAQGTEDQPSARPSLFAGLTSSKSK